MSAKTCIFNQEIHSMTIILQDAIKLGCSGGMAKFTPDLFYNCRKYSTNQPIFMQNKANFKKARMNVSYYLQKDCENELRLCRQGKQSQTKPIFLHPKSGKVDFHACRTAFVTLAAEAGANIKELQTMARHSTPELTANVYARARHERLAEPAEKIELTIFAMLPFPLSNFDNTACFYFPELGRVLLFYFLLVLRAMTWGD